MKNLNKVLAMLVVFMMMLSTVAFASSFADVADTSSYSTAIEVGVDLGLFKGYEDGTFKPEGEITRAEFAAIIVRLLGQEAQAAGAKASTQFVDVPADHWAAGYVNIAVQAGVINGYGDGNFGPEDLVEYQDAITMMVRALGYEPAIGSAGYPTGYLTKAGELGLTTGVNGSNGVAANRGAVAQIAFNALDVPLMTQSGYGTFTQYVINDGYSTVNGTNNGVKKTLLSENHNIVKVQGTVNSSSDSVSTNKNAKEYVEVSVLNNYNNKFKQVNGTFKAYVGETDAMNYVGKKVVMFIEYDEFNDEKTIKSLYEVVAADTLVIDIADFVAFTDGGKDSNGKELADTIEYYANENKTTKVTVSAKASNFYNGFSKSLSAGDWANLKNMSGTIELSLLNNETADANYDTVFVTAYGVFVVDTVSATSKVVRSKFSSFGESRIKYDESNGNIRASLTDAAGNALDWASLEEYDVLAVKYAKTSVKDIYEAYVIENTVTGTVTGSSGKVGSDERYVEIDGTEYKVIKNVEGKNAAGEIKLGDEGTYYLDGSNNIVYHNATITRNNNYAYVIDTFIDTKGMDASKVKVLTKDAGIVTAELANKITVMYKGEKANNISIKNFKADITAKSKDSDGKDTVFADLVNMIKTAEGNGLNPMDILKKQVVTYKLNAAGQVYFVEVAEATAKKGEDFFTKSTVTALNNYDEDRMAFVDANGVKHYLSENTVVFYTGATDVDDYEVVALNNLADGKSLSSVDVYDVNDERIMGAVVIKNKESFSPIFENATFVTKTSTTTDEDGEDVVRVTGYVGLEEVSYICDSTVTPPTLGTLVVPVFAANGDVASFTAVDGKLPENKEEGISGVNGTLATYVEDGETLSPINSAQGFIRVGTKEYDVASNANVYFYDANKTGRIKHVVDAGLDYVEFVVDGTTVEKYIDGELTTASFDVYMYLYDGEVVDVLYVVK